MKKKSIVSSHCRSPIENQISKKFKEKKSKIVKFREIHDNYHVSRLYCTMMQLNVIQRIGLRVSVHTMLAWFRLTSSYHLFWHCYASSGKKGNFLSDEMQNSSFSISTNDDHRVPKSETANGLRKFSHPPLLSFPHLHVSIPTTGWERERMCHRLCPRISSSLQHHIGLLLKNNV